MLEWHESHSFHSACDVERYYSRLGRASIVSAFDEPTSMYDYGRDSQGRPEITFARVLTSFSTASNSSGTGLDRLALRPGKR